MSSQLIYDAALVYTVSEQFAEMNARSATTKVLQYIIPLHL